MKTDQADRIIAVVAIDEDRSTNGFASTYKLPFGGSTVLGHTLSRLRKVDGIEKIVLLYPDSQSPADWLGDDAAGVQMHPVSGDIFDSPHEARISGRKWAPTAWRGGLGDMTCYDEVLCANAMSQAVTKYNATAALIVGGDWPLVDPLLCSQVVSQYKEFDVKLAFNQAPPGLSGIVIRGSVLADMAERRVPVGAGLGYNPRFPQGDPIARDPCVQISAAIRGSMVRAVYDAPRWRQLLDNYASSVNGSMLDISAEEIAPKLHEIAMADRYAVPQQVSLELTPQRSLDGPIVPQAHVDLDREPITPELAKKIFEELGSHEDVAVTLGGLGDALLHPQWRQIVQAAKDAGVWGIHVETDLVTEDQDILAELLDSPVDVISFHMNADTGAKYQEIMGKDYYKFVLSNLEFVVNRIHSEGYEVHPRWFVPRMVKCRDVIDEMESFFDKCMVFCGHAVIEPATTGCGLMPDHAPLSMAPPQRFPCRQLYRRLTIHSNGMVAQCDQDWLSRGVSTDLNQSSVADAWEALDKLRRSHEAADYGTVSSLCGDCREWHRP